MPLPVGVDELAALDELTLTALEEDAWEGIELLEAILDAMLDVTLEAMLDELIGMAELDTGEDELDAIINELEDAGAALDITGADDVLDCAILLDEVLVPPQAPSAMVTVPRIAVRKWLFSRCFIDWFNMNIPRYFMSQYAC